MKRIPITLLLLVMFFNAVVAQKINGKQIKEKSIEATRVKGTEGLATITTINENGQTRIRELASITKLYDGGKTEKKLLKFLQPADVKGTGFLTFDYNKEDDDKWIYMPALRKTRRIINSENAKSFMGTEFSYADMTLPNVDEYHYKMIGEENILGQICYVIEERPINEEVENENGFSKKITYINKENFVSIKSVYFDLYGDKEKIMIVKEYKELDKTNHKYRLTNIEIKNIQNGRKSTNVIKEIKYNPGLPDSYFTTRYIER
ncbi:outer membrane lipoprotein-sorting protein [Marinifilum sp.]|uniref:outer membrane lipoprotein-sorting protein n=1 Tax=Marinifilum sp. TaxID=2033137 RepID=UPI003BACCAEE